jgi:hypothetical protein
MCSPIFRSARELGAYYRSALAHQLQQRGYAIERGTGKHGRYFEIAGVPRGLLDSFSARSREVARAAERFRAQWGRAPKRGELRALKLENRKAKVLVTRADLHASWNETAASFDCTGDKPAQLLGATGESAPDQAVLNLMLDIDRQRPWAEDEIARIISVPGDVRDSLRRLRASKPIHRWNDLAVASHPAVRFHEINHGGGDPSPGEIEERQWDKAVLEGLLVRSADGEGPRSEQQTYEAFGAKKTKKRLAIADALNRLDGDGLIERRGGRAIPSEVARRLDELMAL